MTKPTSTGKRFSAKQNALDSGFYQSVVDVLHNARIRAYRAVNFTMVEAYWNVGRMIVEEEQRGSGRAGYGKRLLKDLSVRLTKEFGKGFDESNLRNIRQFYQTFPIRDAMSHESSSPTNKCTKADTEFPALPSILRRELRWTHFRLLMRVEKDEFFGRRSKPEISTLDLPSFRGEVIVKTLKRDYVGVHGARDARSLLQNLSEWFEDYNENHPHKGLKMMSPREFRRQTKSKLEVCPV